MGEHTVTAFGEELASIQRLLRTMGEHVSAMLGDATRALLDGNETLAQQTIQEDILMDAMQRELDAAAITLLARRQPMAQDLRAVVGAIRIASDMERIGDLAKNIAKRTSAVGADMPLRRLAHGIEEMSRLVQDQVRSVMAHYDEQDAEGLRRLRLADEKIDISYTTVFRELLTCMMEDPRSITAGTHLLFCAKNLERIGDHVTNIAENGYYIITGAQLPVDRPKVDVTAIEKPR